MSFNPQIKDEFEKRGYKISRSESGKKILKFDSSNDSKFLFNFLSYNASFRVVLSSLIKSGFLDLNKALSLLPESLKKNKISFIYEVKCFNCRNILERLNVANFEFKSFKEKDLSCPNCKKKNRLTKSNYFPEFNPEMSEFNEVLFRGCKENVFTLVYSSKCYICESYLEDISGSKKNIKCEKCNHRKYISTSFLPFLFSKDGFLENKQGYWFEWYIKTLIKNYFIFDFGLTIKNGKDLFESDVIILKNKKLIFLECKDSSDDSYIKKLIQINRVADYFFLISTLSMNKDSVELAKKILGKKFILIKPNEIEDIKNKINLLCK